MDVVTPHACHWGSDCDWRAEDLQTALNILVANTDADGFVVKTPARMLAMHSGSDYRLLEDGRDLLTVLPRQRCDEQSYTLMKDSECFTYMLDCLNASGAIVKRTITGLYKKYMGGGEDWVQQAYAECSESSFVQVVSNLITDEHYAAYRGVNAAELEAQRLETEIAEHQAATADLTVKLAKLRSRSFSARS